jgi:hypothetical protein
LPDWWFLVALTTVRVRVVVVVVDSEMDEADSNQSPDDSITQTLYRRQSNDDPESEREGNNLLD